MLTFGPTIKLGTTTNPTSSFPELSNGANWAPYTFTGTSWTNIGATQNSDGSVTLDGTGEAFGNGLSTAVAGNPGAGTAWQGIAFGGGAYFEATMAFTGPASFWANDIETMNGISIGGGPNPWPGLASNYGDWIETDFAEFDTTGVYGGAIHNWYGIVGSGDNTSTLASGSSFPTPAGADYTQPNKYGFLWVPATSTSLGYAKWFFNDQQVGNTIYWNKYDPSLPPPPVDLNQLGGNSYTYNPNGVTMTTQSSAYSMLDNLHLALILGGSTGSTNTISAVSVWQSSAANDIGTVSMPTPAPTTCPSPTPTPTPTPSPALNLQTCGGTYTSLASWQAAINGGDAGATTADPGFTVSGTSGIALWAPGSANSTPNLWGPTAYAISATSPLANAGANVSSSVGGSMGTTDYFLHAIPGSGGYSIGADQPKYIQRWQHQWQYPYGADAKPNADAHPSTKPDTNADSDTDACPNSSSAPHADSGADADAYPDARTGCLRIVERQDPEQRANSQSMQFRDSDDCYKHRRVIRMELH